jgi:plasmid stabilization system protein ParE
MTRVRYTPEADQDLVRIGSYIAEDNPSAAQPWADAIEAVCALLAAQPGIGQRTKNEAVR